MFFAFYVLQQQSRDHDASFLLTENREQGDHLSHNLHQLQLSCENEKEAAGSKQVQEGERGEQVKTVDGCCPDWGGSTFFTDEEKKDFKIESKDRNSPSGKF